MGECTSTIEPEEEEEEEEEISEDNSINNAVNLIKTGGGVFDLGLTSSAVWLILMLVLAYAIYVNSPHNEPHTTFAVIGISMTIMTVLGVVLGYFSWSLIFILGVISAGIVALKMRTAVTGGV